ncbi:MAG: NarK/NasA family nitrate transporter [Candidatus Hydrogenedentota bacterium]
MIPYPASHKWRVLHLSWIAFCSTFFAWFAFPPLAVLAQAEMGFSDSQLGWLITLGAVLTVPGRVLIGKLVDRFGPRAIYAALLVLTAVPVALLGTAQTFGQLAALRLCIGLLGCGFVVGIRIIADWFPRRQLGLAEGIYGGWGNAGSALAALLLPGAAILFGWRVALSLAAVPLLVSSIVYWYGVSDVPEGKVFRRRPIESDYSPWKDRVVIALALAYVASFGSEICVVSFLPKLFFDRFDVSPLYAGMYASLFGILNVVSRPGGGWLADRLGRKAVLLVLLGCIGLGYIGLSAVSSLAPTVAAVVLTSVFVQAACGAVFATAPLVSPRDTGRIAGIIGAAGNVGGIVFPLCFGYGLEWSGGSYAPGFLILSAAAVAALIAVWRVPLLSAETGEDQVGYGFSVGLTQRVPLRGKRRNYAATRAEGKAVG